MINVIHFDFDFSIVTIYRNIRSGIGTLKIPYWSGYGVCLCVCVCVCVCACALVRARAVHLSFDFYVSAYSWNIDWATHRLRQQTGPSERTCPRSRGTRGPGWGDSGSSGLRPLPSPCWIRRRRSLWAALQAWTPSLARPPRTKARPPRTTAKPPRTEARPPRTKARPPMNLVSSLQFLELDKYIGDPTLSANIRHSPNYRYRPIN